LQYFSKYRVLKSSWGIVIDIKGNIEEINSTENEFQIAEKSLTPAEKEQVKRALKSLSDNFHGKKYSICLQEITFNDCDFQIEGLYWACRDWLSKALNIKVNDPEVTYNAKARKYIFKP
jgi:hypothetical protein